MNRERKPNLPKEVEEELKEPRSNDDDGEDDHEDGTHDSMPSSRGGKSALPDCWSRLIHVKPVGPITVKIHSIFTDLEL